MDLEKLFNSFRSCNIAIVGDIMLDKYIFGHVSRISPEYPVPVVDVSEETFRLGGAANVAVNIRAMGCRTSLFGITGADANSDIMLELLRKQDLSTSSIISDASRPTTCKTRILSQNHHIVRVDHESRHHISDALEAVIIDQMTTSIDDFDAIVLEDYNKGVLTSRLIRKIIDLATANNVPVLVDPKLERFFDYQGCSIFKPNLSEVAASLGIMPPQDETEIEIACVQLKEKLGCEHLVITRGEKGMTIFNDSFTHIPAATLDVADVSGAGDTVIAMLALGAASGLDIVTSAEIATLAASTVCQEVGAAPVKTDKLLKACRDYFGRNL